MTQNHLPFVSGRMLADMGMEAALMNANAKQSDWSIQAMDALLVYLSLHPGKEFMAEDVREFAYDVLAVPYPPHCRAWGSIIQKAARNGVIRRLRIAPVRTVSSHSANASVWRAA